MNLPFNHDFPDSRTELRRAALHWLSEQHPALKSEGVTGLAQAWQRGEVMLATDAVLITQKIIPGRPALPALVSPLLVKHRAMHTVEGRAALIHALAHIEFNAINLALDAVWRFPDMPRDYYADWLHVAAEEALHFSLLSKHLQTQGFQYGEFPAHNSLWEMAEKTQDDILARIALVPRTLEARGLDIILRDEIGHVAIGNRWYGWLCAERGLDPIQTYASLAAQYKAPPLRGPFNLAARRAAGFSEAELVALGQ